MKVYLSQKKLQKNYMSSGSMISTHREVERQNFKTLSKGRHPLSVKLTDESVEVRVGGPLYVQVPPADVVDGLVVHHEGTVSVVEGGVGGEDGIVGLHHSYKPHFSGGQLLAQSNLWILSVRGRW